MCDTKEVELRFEDQVYFLTATADVTVADVKQYLSKHNATATPYTRITNAVFTNDYIENNFKIHDLYKNVDPITRRIVLRFEKIDQPNFIVPKLSALVRQICAKRGVQMVETPRRGKKMLVLDIDGTICDGRLIDTHLETRMDRPYLHHFLAAVYRYYDIAFWSSTNMQAIERKINNMELINRPEFKIMAYIDKQITKHVEEGGVGPILTKPLVDFFRYYPNYNFKNTIICDDQLHNFMYNPQNGLGIYQYQYRNRNHDNYLLILGRYLVHLAKFCTNFSYLNHLLWLEYGYAQHASSLKDIVTRKYGDYGIKVINRPRANKRLLLLDIDHTICDPTLFGTVNEANAGRPYLHKFLNVVYPYYDIGLWCYCDLALVEQRARLLRLEGNRNFQLTFYITSMYYEYDFVKGVGIIAIKPLQRIWTRFKQYSKSNTLICDDISACYSMNVRNGLPVLPYKHENRANDVVLLKLGKYLRNIIGPYSNFCEMGHLKWYRTLEASITYSYSVPSLKEAVTYYLARHGLKILDKVRRGKRLLVLDFDFTLYDSTYFKTKLQYLAVRPYLQDLLISAHEDYNIAIWSNTKMVYLEEKIKTLRINDNPNYRIVCLLDQKATVVRSMQVHYEPVAVKPLENIFRFMKMFDSTNTLICDDQVLNFQYDANNGIRIKGYNMFTRQSDKELLQLKIYLKHLARTFPDFSNLRHIAWFTFPEASLNHVVKQKMSSLSGMLKWYCKELGIQFFNLPRRNKKLLVLNAEHVICDELVLGSKDAARPYLHSFLTSVYQYYDIVIWYNCSIADIHKRLQLLGIEGNPNYKILLYINGASSIPKRIVKKITEVKPLGVLWDHLKCYNYTNTIICDHNFDSYYDNEHNGILVKKYFRENRLRDKVLLKLGKYLIDIARTANDFSLLEHSNWFITPAAIKFEEFEPISLLHNVSSFLRNHGLEILNQPRKGKKLLVLDVDYVIFDPTYHGRVQAYLGARPYLHEFLRSVSEEYDIGFWSNTTMYHLKQKLRLLALEQNPEYRFIFYADINASRRTMIVPLIYAWAKPLTYIFQYIRDYNFSNAVICDIEHKMYNIDVKNTLCISTYCRGYRNSDKELLKLKNYLKFIANNYDDFENLNHTGWFNSPEASLD